MWKNCYISIVSMLNLDFKGTPPVKCSWTINKRSDFLSEVLSVYSLICIEYIYSRRIEAIRIVNTPPYLGFSFTRNRC